MQDVYSVSFLRLQKQFLKNSLISLIFHSVFDSFLQILLTKVISLYDNEKHLVILKKSVMNTPSIFIIYSNIIRFNYLIRQKNKITEISFFFIEFCIKLR